MEALARKLCDAINEICIEYYYNLKNGNAVDKALALREDIEKLAGGLFAALGNDSESEELRSYTVGVLNDYIEAVKQRDEVLMLDTLDYGLRDILMIYIDEEEGAENNGQ
ncbi:MAG: hypothetical protein NC223_00735 [Butyrivibrio sp.]|nr:hypothetical protein [Butyrivibrio sp.]